MVKNVVKTHTSKKHKWSPKNRSSHQEGGSSKKKSRRTKHGVVSPKIPNPNMWSIRTKTAWSGHVVEAFESREANSHLKGFSSSAGVVL